MKTDGGGDEYETERERKKERKIGGGEYENEGVRVRKEEKYYEDGWRWG